MTTWYQTKYALTTGIIEISDGKISGTCADYISHGQHGFDKIGVDIFDSLDAAKADQRKRVSRAIQSAKKKIAKLEALINE